MSKPDPAELLRRAAAAAVDEKHAAELLKRAREAERRK